MKKPKKKTPKAKKKPWSKPQWKGAVSLPYKDEDDTRVPGVKAS